MGKSSALQTILLLRQSFLKHLLSKGLDLNGDLCSIGTAKDAIFISAETNEIEFEIKQNNLNDWKLVFKVDRNKIIDTFLRTTSPYVIVMESAPIFTHDMDCLDPIPQSSIFNNNFQYISAFRNGPLAFYEKDTALVEISNQMSRREGRCELVAHYLYHFKEATVSDKLLTKTKDDDPTLKFQVMEWMREISPEIDRIHIDEISDIGYKVEYSFSRGKGETETNKFRAIDVGFGISYALPIIVAALHTPKDGLVLIENPESHIHPAGQAKLMELICKSAKAGVQFIIETHSDHIINGLLVATKKGFIDHDEARVYYFDRKISTHATQVTNLPVLPGGKIKKPPKGFFDQIAKDLTTLMGLKEWG